MGHVKGTVRVQREKIKEESRCSTQQECGKAPKNKSVKEKIRIPNLFALLHFFSSLCVCKARRGVCPNGAGKQNAGLPMTAKSVVTLWTEISHSYFILDAYYQISGID